MILLSSIPGNISFAVRGRGTVSLSSKLPLTDGRPLGEGTVASQVPQICVHGGLLTAATIFAVVRHGDEKGGRPTFQGWMPYLSQLPARADCARNPRRQRHSTDRELRSSEAVRGASELSTGPEPGTELRPSEVVSGLHDHVPHPRWVLCYKEHRSRRSRPRTIVEERVPRCRNRFSRTPRVRSERGLVLEGRVQAAGESAAHEWQLRETFSDRVPLPTYQPAEVELGTGVRNGSCVCW